MRRPGPRPPLRERLTAGLYDVALEPLMAGFRRAALRMAPAEPGMRVLDVGCGTGRHLALYRSGGAQVTGIDLSAGMLERAARNLGPDARLIAANAEAIPFDDGSFDLVMATTVLHAVPPDSRVRVLGEMGRVARSDGALLVVDVHPGALDGLKARAARLIDSSIERAAGRDHYRNYRHFLTAGGLPELAAGLGLSIRDRKLEASGTMGVYLLR